MGTLAFLLISAWTWCVCVISYVCQDIQEGVDGVGVYRGRVNSALALVCVATMTDWPLMTMYTALYFVTVSVRSEEGHTDLCRHTFEHCVTSYMMSSSVFQSKTMQISHWGCVFSNGSFGCDMQITSLSFVAWKVCKWTHLTTSSQMVESLTDLGLQPIGTFHAILFCSSICKCVWIKW